MAFEGYEFDTESPLSRPTFMRGLMGVDAVFHLTSLAVDKPSFYEMATNPARTMDVSLAANIDRKLELIYKAACKWSKVPHHVFPNDGSFDEKKTLIAERLLEMLCGESSSPSRPASPSVM